MHVLHIILSGRETWRRLEFCFCLAGAIALIGSQASMGPQVVKGPQVVLGNRLQVRETCSNREGVSVQAAPLPPRARMSKPNMGMPAAVGHQPDAHYGAPLHSSRVSLPPAPAANAFTSERIDFMHQQLDNLGVEAEALPGLVLLGNGIEERLQGGAVSYCDCSCNYTFYMDVSFTDASRKKE
jgi:hypothetical protein